VGGNYSVKTPRRRVFSARPCGCGPPVTGRIDVLYNNASMAYFSWLPDMTYEMWSKTLREELDVVFHGFWC
jgi:NAD(P)-dependent dehydrogenase (short-subunit alcohol dehydrogenase family)